MLGSSDVTLGGSDVILVTLGGTDVTLGGSDIIPGGSDAEEGLTAGDVKVSLVPDKLRDSIDEVIVPGVTLENSERLAVNNKMVSLAVGKLRESTEDIPSDGTLNTEGGPAVDDETLLSVGAGLGEFTGAVDTSIVTLVDSIVEVYDISVSLIAVKPEGSSDDIITMGDSLLNSCVEEGLGMDEMMLLELDKLGGNDGVIMSVDISLNSDSCTDSIDEDSKLPDATSRKFDSITKSFTTKVA